LAHRDSDFVRIERQTDKIDQMWALAFRTARELSQLSTKVDGLIGQQQGSHAASSQHHPDAKNDSTDAAKQLHHNHPDEHSLKGSWIFDGR
jgi:hypothetical protein